MEMGYEPIECAFGQRGSVLGPLKMDHHGTESHREGVAIRACRDHFGARMNDPRFVVTGAPDADAVLAIVALAALVPKACIKPSFYDLVNRFDVDPIGIDLFEEDDGAELAWFNHLQGLEQSEKGFRMAIDAMIKLLTTGVDQSQIQQTRRTDAARRRTAEQGICASFGYDGQQKLSSVSSYGSIKRGQQAIESEAIVVVTRSPVWGFDVWYRMAPIVVSYAERLKKITVGVSNKETAELLFGPGGLDKLWAQMGSGWGGRESVGGSPRGEEQPFEMTTKVAQKIIELTRRSTRSSSQ